MAEHPWPAVGATLGIPSPEVDPHAATDPRHARGARRTRLAGTWRGAWAEVGTRQYNTRDYHDGGGSLSRSHYTTYARAHLPLPLDMGIDYSSIQHVKAGDRAFAQRLLSLPYVAEAVQVRRREPILEIEDQWVSAVMKGMITDPRQLSTILDIVVDMARRLDAGLREIGPTPGHHAMANGWKAVAERNGLALDPAEMSMRGRYRTQPVEVRTTVSSQGRRTVFEVPFEPPLGIALRMYRQRRPLGFFGKLVGLQDIETGDPSFDERFVIEGSPEDAVRGLLTPEVRAALAELQDQTSGIAVRDDHLSAAVDWLVTEPQHLESGMASVTRVAATLLGVRQGGGPYRG